MQTLKFAHNVPDLESRQTTLLSSEPVYGFGATVTYFELCFRGHGLEHFKLLKNLLSSPALSSRRLQLEGCTYLLNLFFHIMVTKQLDIKVDLFLHL